MTLLQYTPHVLQQDSRASSQFPSRSLWGSPATFSAFHSSSPADHQHPSPAAASLHLAQQTLHHIDHTASPASDAIASPSPASLADYATAPIVVSPETAPETTANHPIPHNAQLPAAPPQYQHPEIRRAESTALDSNLQPFVPQLQQQSAADGWGGAPWVGYEKISRQHEFSVEVVSGSAQSCFKFTKFVHIKDKYIIENRTGEVLDVRSPLLFLQCSLWVRFGLHAWPVFWALIILHRDQKCALRLLSIAVNRVLTTLVECDIFQLFQEIAAAAVPTHFLACVSTGEAAQHTRPRCSFRR